VQLLQHTFILALVSAASIVSTAVGKYIDALLFSYTTSTTYYSFFIFILVGLQLSTLSLWAPHTYTKSPSIIFDGKADAPPRTVY
jgi:hypothetical protein